MLFFVDDDVEIFFEYVCFFDEYFCDFFCDFFFGVIVRVLFFVVDEFIF